MTERTSEEVASKASSIMLAARMTGGPVFGAADEIKMILNSGAADDEMVQKLDTLLRPYIDDAESVAASALTQREP